MSSETPPGASFPENPDPDRTIEHRTPRPAGSDTSQFAYGPAEELEFGDAQGAHLDQPYQPEAEPTKRKHGWLIGIIAAVFVVLVGGGGVWAFSMLSGGGTQPDEVLPGNALAYVRLDLDPAANQKLALFSIARKFPGTKETFSGDDPRQALFAAIKADSPELSGLDYAKDVEPWLGDRVGLAVLPPANSGEQPGFAVAVQVKDETAARAGIAKLSAGEKYGVTFRSGYAIVAQTQAEADGYAKATPLSQNSQFSTDLSDIGEPGVLSFWAHLGNLVKSTGVQAPDASLLSSIKNIRFAGALRFDSDYVEFTAMTHGGTVAPGAPKPVKIGQLPSSTVGALSVSGLGAVFDSRWPELEKAAAAQAGGESFTQSLEQIKQAYGLSIPDDLVTLFGDNLTIALDGQGLDAEQPNVGAILTTDPAKAEAVVGKLERLLSDTGVPMQLGKTPGAGQFVVASNQGYADKLAAKGTLGDSESFKLAVPNADSASYAAYVDFDKLEPLYLSGLQGEEKANAQVLRAVGLSGSYDGAHSTVSLRVLFN